MVDEMSDHDLPVACRLPPLVFLLYPQPHRPRQLGFAR